jgi:hypothetical protein
MAIKPVSTSLLREAREYVELERDEGVTCPCCGQFAKVYRRTIHSAMARSAIDLYQRQAWLGSGFPADIGSGNEGWTHLTRAGNPGGDEAKLRYWGLLEQRDAEPEHGRTAGEWRLTKRGVHFVRDALVVPKYALIYNGDCLAHEGPLIGIRQALGSKFDYKELMER